MLVQLSLHKQSTKMVDHICEVSGLGFYNKDIESAAIIAGNIVAWCASNACQSLKLISIQFPRNAGLLLN